MTYEDLPHHWHLSAAWAYRNLAARVAVSFYKDGILTKEELRAALRNRVNWRPTCCQDKP